MAKYSPQYILTQQNPNIEQQLGFVANSAIVDNYTNAFVDVEGGNRSIPPFTWGAVVNVGGTQVATAKLVQTTPASIGPAVPSQGCTIVYTDAVIAPQPGFPLSLNTFASQQLIDSFTQAPNVVVNNRLYLLPAGTQSVRIQINQNAQPVAFANFKVLGAGTGVVYIFPSSGSGTAGGFDEWFKPNPSDVIQGILFSLDTTGSANGVEVVITADTGSSFVVASLTGPGTSTAGPLLVENTTAALWQTFPGTSRIDVTSTGVDVVAIAGVANKRLYLGPASIFGGAAARYAFKDGIGGPVIWVQPVLANTPTPIAWNGRILGVGNDLAVNVGAGNEIEFSGSFNQG